MILPTPAAALRRFRRVAAFVTAGGSPAQWLRLALLGWSRDNPSGAAARWFHAVDVRPAILRGQRLTINPRDIGQLISFEEVFVEAVYELGLVPFTPTAIFDCGAHVGFFSALAAAAYPRVPITAFEPNPDNVEWLRQNLSSLSAGATVRAAAVSVSDGTASFAAPASNAGHLGAEEEGGIRVQVVDLVRLLPTGPDAALLIKLDVEGEERRLLPHLLPALPHRCAMFVETHDGVEAREQLMAAIQGHDFRVSCLRERAAFADLFAVRGAA